MKSSLRYVPRFVLGATGAIVMSLLLSLPMMLLAAITSSAAPNYYLARLWAWVISTLFSVRYSLHQGEKADPNQSYIVAPNHQSNVDILAILAMVPVKYRWVVKKSLLKIPFFGWGLKATGAISIDRSNPQASLGDPPLGERQSRRGMECAGLSGRNPQSSWQSSALQERRIHDGGSNRGPHSSCLRQRRVQDDAQEHAHYQTGPYNRYSVRSDSHGRID